MNTRSKKEIEGEARETCQRFVAMRDDIDAGKHDWDKLTDLFT